MNSFKKKTSNIGKNFKKQWMNLVKNCLKRI